MSRSGYSDDYDYVELYRATVERALQGKRGQAFLRELAESLDAMPEKRLIAEELIDGNGNVCAIGAVCKSRGVDVSRINYEAPEQVGKAVGIARCMAAEIEYMNDEWCDSERETPEQRWTRMRKWVQANIIP
jgi:hypothetical protein